MADEQKSVDADAGKDAMEMDKPAPAPVDPAVALRRQILADFRKKLLEHRELEAKVRSCMARIGSTFKS